jgi:hypothetical protein
VAEPADAGSRIMTVGWRALPDQRGCLHLVSSDAARLAALFAGDRTPVVAIGAISLALRSLTV